MERKIKIVTDSSSDILSMDGIDFASAPMKIITDEREFTDDASLDVYDMADYLQHHHGKSTTSCPNVDDWISAFGDADEIYCITITGQLSGSHNTARIARETYIENHPNAKVFVFDSLSTGPEMGLIADKMRELILDGKEFEEICEYIEKYSKRTGLLFMLESMKNLANNGRVSHLTASMAGILGIRAIGKASDEGRLEMLDKCRGERKTLETIIARLKELGLTNGKVKIGYCCNESVGKSLKDLIHNAFENAKVELYRCCGLCTYYAEMGGLLVGFEKA